MLARFEIIRLALNSYGDFLGEAEVYWPGKGPQLINIYRNAGVIHSGPDGAVAAVTRFNASDLEAVVPEFLPAQLLEHAPDLIDIVNRGEAMTVHLTHEEARRAQTWNLTIAAVLISSDVPWADEGDERKWTGLGGFHLDKRNGAWFSFAADIGGYSSTALVRLLKPEYSQEEAVDWVRAFLHQHPGTGPCGADVDEDDAGDAQRRARAAIARHILDTMVPVEGTVAEKYLLSRALPPPYDATLLGYVEDARVGEGALCAVLRANDRVVGVQCCYLDPDGNKSLVLPIRRRFNLEPAPDAVFEIQPATVQDFAADLAIAEGLEDGLSVAQLGRHWRLVAMPGIGALQHIAIAKGERVLVVRDGDVPDSEPDKALPKGIDHLLLAGAAVKVTGTPIGEDANSTLCMQNADALGKLVAGARDATLSTHGEIVRISRINDDLDRARAIKETARRIDIDVGSVRKAVTEKLRQPKPAADADELRRAYAGDADEVWAGRIDLGVALDVTAAAIARYVAAPAAYATIGALWAAATHIVRDENLGLPVMPQLGLIWDGPDSGKSTLLEVIAAAAYRGRLTAAPTLATLFRIIHVDRPTYFLPELHNLDPERNKDLRAVTNACHRRAEAWVERIEEINGRRVPVPYFCWAALAWGAIGSLPDETMSRAIVLPMKPATAAESAALSHSSPNRDLALIKARRQFSAWSATVNVLGHVDLPKGLINRRADNWRVLFLLAQKAGGDWPRRAREAYTELATQIEPILPETVRLLISIHAAFHPEPTEENGKAPAPHKQLKTSELITALLNEEAGGWMSANNHRPIDPYWLRGKLRGLIKDPAKARDWWEGPAAKREHVSGYGLEQFQDAWERYRIPLVTHPAAASGASGASGAAYAHPTDAVAKNHAPDAASDAGRAPDARTYPTKPATSGAPDNPVHDRVQENASQHSNIDHSAPDAPDAPDSVGQVQCAGNGKETAVVAGRRSPTRGRRPNGHNPKLPGMRPKPPPPPRDADAAAIRALHAQHPQRKREWLAKQLGLPLRRVAEVLDDGAA